MLRDRWLTLCRTIGRRGEDPWRLLEAVYTQGDRAYHNLGHIEACLAQLDEHADLARDPVALELAIWFHDFVYDTRASDNEAKSADAAAVFLAGTSMARLVAQLIEATTHGSNPTLADARLLCDIDLVTLGTEPDCYRTYAEAIREEYAWVPQGDYVAERTRILEAFLRRPCLYWLQAFRDRYEEQARHNLQAEIDELSLKG